MGAGVSAATDTSFEAFVRTSSARLVTHATYLCGDRWRAQDLVQDVLVRVYPRWARICRDDPYPYVARSVTNAAVDAHRRASRRRETPLEAVPEPVAADEPGAVELADALDLLAVLTPRERSVVVLRYFQDLTEVQTADVLGIAVGTVKSSHSSAMARLRASGHPAVSGVRTGREGAGR